MKKLLLLILITALYSCRKEAACENEGYGTIIITNTTSCNYRVLIASQIDTIPFFYVYPGNDTTISLKGGLVWAVGRNCTNFFYTFQNYEVESCRDYELIL